MRGAGRQYAKVRRLQSCERNITRFRKPYHADPVKPYERLDRIFVSDEKRTPVMQQRPFCDI